MAYQGAGRQSPIDYESAGHRLEDLPSYVRVPYSSPYPPRLTCQSHCQARWGEKKKKKKEN